MSKKNYSARIFSTTICITIIFPICFDPAAQAKSIIYKGACAFAAGTVGSQKFVALKCFKNPNPEFIQFGRQSGCPMARKNTAYRPVFPDEDLPAIWQKVVRLSRKMLCQNITKFRLPLNNCPGNIIWASVATENQNLLHLLAIVRC